MKKLIIITILSLLLPLKVNALEKATLNYYFSNDLWYTMRGGGKPYSSMQYATYNLNDITAYCIEPGIQILTTAYEKIGDFNNLPYSEEINKKIELIGYYGYDYPNHNTLKYRMATQALIWEEITGQIVEFWTGPSGSGTHISVENERNEILRLINNHNNKPSFDGMEFYTNILEEIEITDLNNTLDEYEIIETNEFEYKIENNKLFIKPLVVGNIEVTLNKKTYNNKETKIYRGEDKVSQMIAFFGINKVSTSININSYGKIEITKLGEKESFKNNELNYEYIEIEGFEYSLYANKDILDNKGNIVFKKDELISKNITNNTGNIIFKNLNIGEYKIIETKTLDGYIVDEKEYIVIINEKDKIKELELKSNLIKTTMEVPSTYKNTNYIIEVISITLIIIGLIFRYEKIY